jgi:hypothetical protein
MGLHLRRQPFDDWFWEFGAKKARGVGRQEFVKRLEAHIGGKIEADAWVVDDHDSPKVGSYTSYGVFFDCLRFVAEGDYGAELADDEDIEREALDEFRTSLRPGSLSIPYASHFLDTEPWDTLFIPVLFDRPFTEDGRHVASLPGAVLALAAFAAGLGFDLSGEPAPEFDGGRWLPVATALNIAAMLHGFFTTRRDACIAFV